MRSGSEGKIHSWIRAKFRLISLAVSVGFEGAWQTNEAICWGDKLEAFRVVPSRSALDVCSHDPDFSFSVFSSADEIFTRSFSSDFPHSLILIDFSRFSSDASKFVVLHRQIYIFSPQREVCTQDFLALIQIFSFSQRAAFPLEISPNFHSTNSANGLHCFQPFLLILQLLCFLFSLRPFFLRTRKNRSWKKVVPRENFHRGFTHFATRLFIQLKAYRSLRIPSIFIPSNLPFDNKIFIGK